MENVERNPNPTRKHISDIPSDDKNLIETSGGPQLERVTSTVLHIQESPGQHNDAEINETQPLSLKNQEEQALLTIKRGSGSPTDFKRNLKRKPILTPSQGSISKPTSAQPNITPETKVEQDFLSGFSSVELEASRILGLIGQARDLRVASDAESVGSNAFITEVEVSPPGSIRSSPERSMTPDDSRTSSPIQFLEKTSGVTSKMSIHFATSDSSYHSSPSVGSFTKTPASTSQVSSGPSSPESNVQEDFRSEEEGTSSTIYRCDFPSCGKTFGRLYNLKSHTRTHTDDRPFKCEQCEQAFSRNHDLKRHQKIHSGLKPFECGGCGKKFSRMDALGRHRTKKPQCQEKST